MEENFSKRSFKAQQHTMTFLTVYNTGVEKCRRGHTWGPGVRDHYLVHLVCRGKGTYALQGHEWQLGAGDLFLVPPGETVCYRADMAEPWEYCWVGFQGIDARTLCERAGLTADTPVRRLKDIETPRKLMTAIVQASGARLDDALRMTGCLCILFAHLVETAGGSAARPANGSLEHVQRACAYIANNYSRAIAIGDITRAVGICRSRLYRAFEEQMGVSPARYLTHFRIEQARRLLETTNLSVKTIAYSVGFEDPLYFSRRFRELVGCPPRTYAQQTLREEKRA
mgnify:CR=1 FL=1